MTNPLSPTLRKLSADLRPKAACASCPESVWYTRSQSLECFCRAFRGVMYKGDKAEPHGHGVKDCDAREAALSNTDM